MINHQAPRLQRYLHQFDWLLLLFLLATATFGLITLEGDTHGLENMRHIFPRQLTWFAVSLIVFCLTLLISYRWFRWLGWPFYAFVLLLLLLLLFASKYQIGFLSAIRSHGAASWFRIPLGGRSLTFQPSELAKIATVMAIAQWLAWRRKNLNRIWEAIPPFLIILLPMAIIFKQPDFGTASVFLPIPIVLLFVAGLPWRIVITTTLIGLIIATAGIIYLMQAQEIPGLRKYQVKRIHVFLEPLANPFKKAPIEEILHGPTPPRQNEQDQEERKQKLDQWNIEQAELALGSGRLFGKGWRKGTQSRYSFLPQHHTDFIFSSLGEQFGLVGCLSLLGLYLLITWRALHIAIHASDAFGKYLVIGLLAIFLTHIILNIGMTIRLLPVTGLPLPLMSYGGSFLATNFLIFGLIANVGMRRRGDGLQPHHGSHLR